MRTWVLLLLCLAVVVAVAHAERNENRRDKDREQKRDKKTLEEKKDDKPRRNKAANKEKQELEENSNKKLDGKRPKKLTERNENRRDKERERKRDKKTLEEKKDDKPRRIKAAKKGKQELEENSNKKLDGKRTKKLTRPPKGNSGRPQKPPRRPGNVKTLKTSKKQNCPGTCVGTRNECDGRIIGKRGCEDGEFCCRKAMSRKTDIKRFCGPLTPCDDLKGECRKKRTGCKKGEKRYKNKKNKQYCDKKSCVCCVSACETKNKCSNEGGVCQLLKDGCEGRFEKSSRYCKGNKCGCCIPPPPIVSCKTKGKCEKKGGFCQSLSSSCDGKWKTGRKYCKGDSCGCCIPGDIKDWCYFGCKYVPEKWEEKFPLCGEEKQSPINIISDDAEGHIPWEDFTFKNYDLLPKKMTLSNKGLSAKVEAEFSSAATVNGGYLKAEYTFLQFHFHWGSDDSKGSEHTLDGHMYPAELHLVHFKTEYGSVDEAITHADGLAVLGIFLEIGSENNKLDNIIDGLASITEAESKTSIDPFALQDLLPNNVKDFYRYSGSLTTPTCNEVVTWTVFTDTISISSSQIAQFRTLLCEGNRPLVDNFRPVQPLNDRKVFKEMEWGYHDPSGPSVWPTYFLACGGLSQSPINIVTADASGIDSWNKFNFQHYDAVPSTMTLKNNGHTATVSATMSPAATMEEGNLGGEYTFLQFHFHWGSDDSKGSEHTIDGNSYPNELHLVHFKTSYGDVGEAIKHADGLAVLGIFLEISPSDNNKLKNIIDGLANIHESGSETDIVPFALQDLLPSNRDEFYRYQGSLTTPTCNEVVTWTVFKDTITISAAQMEAFRKLKDNTHHHIVDNFRPVEPLNGREVYDANL